MAVEALPALDCASASLRRAARAVSRAYDAELRSTGLKSTQLTLLQALGRAGTSTQAALGERLALDSTTLSRTLRPLARGGLIRATAGEDRREVRWTLTPAGRRRLERALPAWERAQTRLRERVGPKYWKFLVEDLAAVAAAAAAELRLGGAGRRG